MLRSLIITTLIFSSYSTQSQVLLSTTYLENFGTTDITAWTDNSTITGWYATDTGSPMHEDITTAAPTNTGRFYSYECNGDNDQKIGSRPSGSTNDIYYGVRLRNTSGGDIDFLLIEFDWYQFSLAQNNSNANTVSFAYRQAATVTDLTTGTYTAVGALDFTAPQSSTACCSAQIEGYPCTEGGSNSHCLTVNIPNGEEIMLRWQDPNDGANDHHMGIDNFFVGIATDNTCAFILNTEIINFQVHREADANVLNWEVQSTLASNTFEIEKSYDGVNFQLIGENSEPTNASGYADFNFTDQASNLSEMTYYRLKYYDEDGNSKYSVIRSVQRQQSNISFHNGHINLSASGQISHLNYNIYSLTGQLISTGVFDQSVQIPWTTAGIFIVELPEIGRREKVVVPGTF